MRKIIIFTLFLFATCSMIGQVTELDALPNYSWNVNDEPKSFNKKLQFSFVNPVSGFPSYGTVMAGGAYSTSQDGGAFQLFFPYSLTLGGVAPRVRLGKYNNQGWSDWETFYTTANANATTIDWKAKTLLVADKIGIDDNSPITKLDLGNQYSNPGTFPNKISLWYGGPNNYAGFGASTSDLDYFSQSNHRFYTEYNGTPGSEKMVISANGNVGIGTANPITKLDLGNQHSDPGEYPNKIALWYGGPNKYMGFGVSGADLDYLSQKNHRFYTDFNGTPGTEKMAILTNGNVGIGAINPSMKLELGDLGTNDGIKFGSIVKMRTSGAGTNHFVMEKIAPTGNIFIRSKSTETQTGNLILNDAGGNVGIGTNNPNGWKLAVNGNIRAKEIKVETGWSDFVFKEDYKLPTLQEVERHIQEKGHLQDIPSAKEVAENGVFLGEMDSKLLQKIEELMLYTIALNKQVKELKEQVISLEEKGK